MLAPHLEQSDQDRDYIETDGASCRCCNSDALLRDPLMQDERGITQIVTCMTCANQWRDVFVLIDVQDV